MCRLYSTLTREAPAPMRRPLQQPPLGAWHSLTMALDLLTYHGALMRRPLEHGPALPYPPCRYPPLASASLSTGPIQLTLASTPLPPPCLGFDASRLSLDTTLSRDCLVGYLTLANQR